MLLMDHNVTQVDDLAPMDPPLVPDQALHPPALLHVQRCSRSGKGAIWPQGECFTPPIDSVITKATSDVEDIDRVEDKAKSKDHYVAELFDTQPCSP